MSTMGTDHLQRKLIERRAKQFGAVLKGVDHWEIQEIPESDFDAHRDVLRRCCNLDAIPEKKWIEPVDGEEILVWICPRIAQLGTSNIYVPFELPFILKLRVSDCVQLVQSVWDWHKTKDLTIYSDHPFVVIDLQDREYELCYFEIANENALRSNASDDQR